MRGTTYRLNWRWSEGSKIFSLWRKPADSEPLLLSNTVGITWGALKLHRNRVFLTPSSALAEATVICDSSSMAPIKVDALAEYLLRATFVLFQYEEGRRHFHLEDPVPTPHPDYGRVNKGYEVIFSASTHDPGFRPNRKLNIVTDGNNQVCRKIDAGERARNSTNRGRPKGPTRKKSQRIRVRRGRPGKAKQSTSRCKAVAKLDVEPTKGGRADKTSGVFAAVSMEAGRNEILEFGEMLIPECTAYKLENVRNVTQASAVGVLRHDCPCQFPTHVEGIYCDRCLLDAWHAKRHKCDKARYDPKREKNASVLREGDNSQAAEQLWPKLNALKCTETTRPHYRCFLRNYCKWRNNYLRRTPVGRQDVNPCFSRRRAEKRH